MSTNKDMTTNQEAPNKETISESKPPRGRPKSPSRLHAERLRASGLCCDGETTRTKINFAFSMTLLGMLCDASEDEQIKILGFSNADISSGTRGFPVGYLTTATEIGRYLEYVGNTEVNKASVMRTLLDARDRGVKWRDIKAHFRILRIGQRSGNVMSLFLCLVRAYDEYVRAFPGTTQQQRIGGVINLLDSIKNPEE